MRPTDVYGLGIDRRLYMGFKVEASDPDLTMLENLQKYNAPNRTLMFDNVVSAGRKGIVELPRRLFDMVNVLGMRFVFILHLHRSQAQDMAGYLLKRADLYVRLNVTTHVTMVKSRNWLQIDSK